MPKRQTIRAFRKKPGRHARPQELLQLYTGLRTKDASMIGEARCISVTPIAIWLQAGGGIEIVLAGRDLSRQDVEMLALADGFSGAEDMAAFWRAEHEPAGMFEGVLIKWKPLT